MEILAHSEPHILPNVNQKSNNIISSIGFPATVAVLSEVSVLKQSFYSPRIFWSAILCHISTSRSDFKEKFQKVLKGYSKRMCSPPSSTSATNYKQNASVGSATQISRQKSLRLPKSSTTASDWSSWLCSSISTCPSCAISHVSLVKNSLFALQSTADCGSYSLVNNISVK